MLDEVALDIRESCLKQTAISRDVVFVRALASQFLVAHIAASARSHRFPQHRAGLKSAVNIPDGCFALRHDTIGAMLLAASSARRHSKGVPLSSNRQFLQPDVKCRVPSGSAPLLQSPKDEAAPPCCGCVGGPLAGMIGVFNLDPVFLPAAAMQPIVILGNHAL